MTHRESVSYCYAYFSSRILPIAYIYALGCGPGKAQTAASAFGCAHLGGCLSATCRFRSFNLAGLSSLSPGEQLACVTGEGGGAGILTSTTGAVGAVYSASTSAALPDDATSLEMFVMGLSGIGLEPLGFAGAGVIAHSAGLGGA